MANRSTDKNSLTARSAHAFGAATLLFFILYTAPHRVHHFFDQVKSASQEHSGDHHQSQQPNKSGAESECVFQLSASRCALRVSAPFQGLALTRLVQELFFSNDNQHQISFFAAAFHIRAPPNS